MYRAFLAIAFLAALGFGMGPSPASAHTYSGVHCGRERWSAKTFSDGVPVDVAHPIVATVDQLRALPRPGGVDGFDAPRVRAEQHVYTVHAEADGARLEDDSDIHLVLAQPGNLHDTMVAEIPDPNCMHGAPAALVADVARARLAFVRAFGIPPTTHFMLLYRPVTVTGALFFDFLHDQDGLAPNGAELHGVIALDGTTVAAGRATAARAPASGQSTCDAHETVWVNTHSGVYHFPGSRWYGHTREGAFMSKHDADAKGYRAARNERDC